MISGEHGALNRKENSPPDQTPVDASQVQLPGLVTHMTRDLPLTGRDRASPNTGHGMITVFPFATASLATRLYFNYYDDSSQILLFICTPKPFFRSAQQVSRKSLLPLLRLLPPPPLPPPFPIRRRRRSSSSSRRKRQQTVLIISFSWFGRRVGPISRQRKPWDTGSLSLGLGLTHPCSTDVDMEPFSTSVNEVLS